MIWAQGRPRTPFWRNLLKMEKFTIFIDSGRKFTKKNEKVILGGFYGFRADRTPPGPMNLLCISMVWGAFGRPGARRGVFSIFYVKIKKTHGNHEISENCMKFQENNHF